MYTAQMDGGRLLFVTEVLVLQFIALAKRPLNIFLPFGKVLPLHLFIVLEIAETLQQLLREPLTDPDFRQMFQEHFRTHPHPGIRSFFGELIELLEHEAG